MVVAGKNNYAAGNGLSNQHEAVVEAGLQFGQRVMSAVRGRPKMNNYDHATKNFSCKNVPLLAMIVEKKDEVSSATTSNFLQNMIKADWIITDPRKNNNLPIKQGQVFVFSRNDDLFDMNDNEKVAGIVVKRTQAAQGTAESPWSQGEEAYLYELVTERKKKIASGHSSKSGMWPEIMAKFNKEYPLRGITEGSSLRKKYDRIVKKMEAQSSNDTKISASDKKPASKKSAKGATKAVADEAATAMPAAAASTNTADATTAAVLINAPKKRKAKTTFTASTKANDPKKKWKMSAVDSSDEESSSDEDDEWKP